MFRVFMFCEMMEGDLNEVIDQHQGKASVIRVGVRYMLQCQDELFYITG
jgi:hypothetical protein